MASKKRIAAQILKCSPKRIVLDENRLEDITQAITRKDVKFLIKTGAIRKIQKAGISRFRAKKIAAQKRKGRRRSSGSRNGSKNSRVNYKRSWINAARLQRDYVNYLRKNNLIEVPVYKEVYRKIKGGFFRSKGHIKLYLTERGLMKK